MSISIIIIVLIYLTVPLAEIPNNECSLSLSLSPIPTDTSINPNKNLHSLTISPIQLHSPKTIKTTNIKHINETDVPENTIIFWFRVDQLYIDIIFFTLFMNRVEKSIVCNVSDTIYIYVCMYVCMYSTIILVYCTGTGKLTVLNSNTKLSKYRYSCSICIKLQ